MKRRPNHTPRSRSSRTNRSRQGRPDTSLRFVPVFDDDTDLPAAADEWWCGDPSGETPDDRFTDSTDGGWFAGLHRRPDVEDETVDDSAEVFATLERAIFNGRTIRWH